MSTTIDTSADNGASREPAPTTSPTPVLVRLDCRRRTRCLGAVADSTPGRTDEYAPFLDCRACPAYAPERDDEQIRADVVALCVLATGAARGWRRTQGRQGQ